MARVETIVVGGGIGASTPFTLGAFTVVTSTDPKTIGDGNARQDTSSPPKVYIGEASYATTATVLGGATANANIGPSIVIGEGATLIPGASIVGSESVVIGPGASATTGVAGTGGNNVVIGLNASIVSGTNMVVIGRGAAVSGAGGSGNSSVLIGSGATQSSGTSVVTIGASASYAGSTNGTLIGANATISGAGANASSTVIGANAGGSGARNTILGQGCTSSFADCIIIGNAVVTTVANQMVVGSTNGISSVVFGKGVTVAGGQAVTITNTNGTGTNNAAAALTIQAGLSTGNAASPRINFNTGVVGASGAVQQTARTSAAVSNSAVAGDTDFMLWDVDNATLERVTVGAADSGGVGFKLLRIPN